ncbi:nuclear transport factor 2 family protein [Gramella jeungdoensis]|uniref:Nuclear transport factor 2 family protein n=1 Tax=Gramella jeungdoensis TaxID=708091 RepID=A0ABT0Z123_9FLAO|nr:nuclear transport factor 2 family protein [Gramella jeungdoensis]MCM8569422.1 nuclear transport factor 2 family protein [Gramella jeungdoensis]
MKFLKLIPLFALMCFIGCDNPNKEDADDMEEMEVRDPSETNKEWMDAWNANDPDKLQSLTAENAVLYLDGEAYPTDSINPWYNNNAPMMRDLKTSPELKYSSDSIAYEAGTYRHMVKEDSLNTPHEGTYTVIWERDEDDWKVRFMNITEKHTDTTATENE